MATVYILTNQSMPGLIKIGITERKVEERMRELYSSSAVPLPFECYFALEVKDAKLVEKKIHHGFDDYRIKAETNRLFHWFETLFRKEVLEPLIYEKVFSRIVDNLIPNSENIRNALQNMTFHTKYLEYLLKNNDYLIKDKITVIDLLAAANFSVLDYLGLFNLGDNIILKEWYLKIKSRPSFKSLLQDHIIGLNPHENYKFVDI